VVKNLFSATKEFELVVYFQQAVKLHYGQRKKEDVKFNFQYVKKIGVVMPQTCVKNECAVNMRLRRMKSPCVGENVKLLISLDLQVCIMKM